MDDIVILVWDCPVHGLYLPKAIDKENHLERFDPEGDFAFVNVEEVHLKEEIWCHVSAISHVELERVARSGAEWQSVNVSVGRKQKSNIFLKKRPLVASKINGEAIYRKQFLSRQFRLSSPIDYQSVCLSVCFDCHCQ